MPDIESGRIASETGEVSFNGQDAAVAGENTLQPAPAPGTFPVNSVTGRNIGIGNGIFAGSNGYGDVVLEFKSIVVGTGLVLTEDGNTIRIDSLGGGEGGSGLFTGLADGPGAITPNGLLVGVAGSGGSSNTLAFTPAPSSPATVLSWTGSAFQWVARPSGTVSSVGISGTGGINVSGGPITTSGNIALSLAPTGVSPGTYNAATVTVDSTGRVTAISSNTLPPSTTVANLGGGVEVGENVVGGEVRLRTLTASGIVTVSQSTNTINIAASAVKSVAVTGGPGINVIGGTVTNTGTFVVGLTNTGVSAGSYTRPQITVDSYGRITSVTEGNSGTFGFTATGLNGILVSGSPVSSGGTLTLMLGASGVTAGTYSNPTITVDSTGRLTNVVGGPQPITGVTAVGGGANVLKSSSNGAVTLRTLVAGAGVSLTENANTITITSTSGLGTVTSVGINASGGLIAANTPVTTSGNIDLSLTNTGVTAGTYNLATVTVDVKGRITTISNGSALSSARNLRAASASIGEILSDTSSGIASFRGIGVAGGLTLTQTGDLLLIDASGISGGGNSGITALSLTGLDGLVVTGSPVTGSTGLLSVGLGDTGASAGDYVLPSVTVDRKGRITAISNGIALANAVNLRSASTGIGVLLANTANSVASFRAIRVTGGLTMAQTDDLLTIDASSISGTGNAGITSLTVTGSDGIAVTGSPIVGPTGTFSIGLNDNGVVDGSYTAANVTVDKKGRITSISNGNVVTSVGISGGTEISVSGAPITSSGTIALSLATTGVTGGTYTMPTVTVDTKGRITNIANGTVTISGESLTGNGSVDVYKDTVDGKLRFYSVKGTGIVSTALNGNVVEITANAVTSVGLTAGSGISVSGGPITSNGSITVGLANTGVAPGVYASPTVTVDSTGRITSIANSGGGAGLGTVTLVDIAAGAGIDVSGGPITGAGAITVSLSNTGITPGNYNFANVTVDAQGRIIAVANGSVAESANPELSNLANVAINTDLVPDSDEAYNLGSPTNRWKDLYLSGNTIVLGEETISSTNGAVLIGSLASSSIKIGTPSEIEAGTAVEIGNLGSGKTTINFTNLADTPADLSTETGKFLRVNSTGDSIETVDRWLSVATPAELPAAGAYNGAVFVVGSSLYYSDGTDWIETASSSDIPTIPTYTGSNLGTGSNVFKAANGTNFEFRSIKAGRNVTLTSTGTEIIIEADVTGGTTGSGTVTSVDLTAGTGITVSGGPITSSGSISVSLADSGVSNGTYSFPTVTVDSKGRITAISNGTAGTGSVTSVGLTGTNGISVTGNTVTTSGSFGVALTNTGVTTGTYGNANQIPVITVDSTGRITSASTVNMAGMDGALAFSLSVNDGTETTYSDIQTIIFPDSIMSPTSPSGGVSITFTPNIPVKVDGNSYVNATALDVSSSDFALSYDAYRSTSLTLTNSGVTAATYGNASTIPVITVDTKGRVTNVTTTAVIATKLSTARTISLSGDATGSATFDGSANASITATLANSGVTSGTYGSASQVPVVTVDAKGRVTSVTTATVTATTATYATTAGTATTATSATTLATPRTIALQGDASGSTTFDGSANATISATLANSGVTAGTYGSGTQVPVVTVDAKGRVTSVSNANVTAAYATTAGTATTSTTANTLATPRTIALSGDATGSATFDGSSNATISTTLSNSGVTAGTYGNATTVPSFTVDAKGRITGVSNIAVTAGSGTVTSVGLTAGTGISVTGNTITNSGSFTVALANSGVTAGSYIAANVTVDAYGRITSIANGASAAGANLGTGIGVFKDQSGNTLRFKSLLSGTGVGITENTTTGDITVALTNTGVTAGTYSKLTVDTQGRVTVGASLTSTDITTILGYTPLNSATYTFASTNTPNTAVLRDASGNFAANLITASLSGNASSATKLSTARNITLTGDVTGTASFDGTANASITATLANSGVTAGAYTNPTVTVNSKGQVTAITSGTLSASSITVQDEGSTVATTGTVNFTGNAVTVSNVGGVATVVITQPGGAAATGGTEYVQFMYTSGSSGNLSAADAIVSSSANVTATITDTTNCIVKFTFTGYSTPPVSVAVMGQAYGTNEFLYTNVNSVFATRKIPGGGTAASPTILTSFSEFSLQIRMTDTGASASIGQRARAIVMFKF